MIWDVSFPEGPLVLDASALINVLGSGRASDVLLGLSVRCYIEERTLAEITRHPIEGLCHKNELIALQKKCLSIHRMSDDEYAVYLRLVTARGSDALGAGESAAIAAAVGLKAAVILDDRKARRIHMQLFPDAAIASSLSMFLEYGRRSTLDATLIKTIVQRARAEARMNIVKGEEALYRRLVSQDGT